MYQALKGRLSTYPIPEIPLAQAQGKLLLDIGCNWGRWCIAASRRGYIPVGIDPSFEAVRAAYRVADQLGVESAFVVGDARHLPFASRSFDVVFSYSVIQHFSLPDASKTVSEAARAVREDGTVKIELLNRYGARSAWNQARRRFREPRAFEVRYHSPAEIEKWFRTEFGQVTLEADAFFSANAQEADISMLPAHFRAVVQTSEVLKRASRSYPGLVRLADSIFVTAKAPLSPPQVAPAGLRRE